MRVQMNAETAANMKDIRRIFAKRKAGLPVALSDDKYHLENFDLIVWEYVSSDNKTLII